MLCNYSYVGCVHQGKITTRNYKDRKKIYLDKDDQDIIENMHEAIIDKDLFDTVQKILNSHLKTRTAGHRETVYLFSGFLRCNDCGSSLVRCPTYLNGKEYVYYRCRKHKQGHKGCNHPAAIKHEYVYKAVMQVVLDYIEYCCDLKSRIMRLQSDTYLQAEPISILKDRIFRANAYISRQNKLKCTAYEDWKLGAISKDDYLSVKFETDDRVQKKKNEISLIQNRVDFYKGLNDSYWLDKIIQYHYITELSREVIVALVQIIRVGLGQTVHVEFNNSLEIERFNHYLNDSVKNYEQ